MFIPYVSRILFAKWETPGFLASRGVSFTSFWLVDAIRVTGDLATARQIANRPDVRAIEDDARRVLLDRSGRGRSG